MNKHHEIAIELLQSKAKELKEYSMRYEADPETWPELKAKHRRYHNILEAIKFFEENP